MLRFRGFIVALFISLAAGGAAYGQNNDLPIVPAKGYDVTSYTTTVWLNRIKDSLSGVVEMKAKSLGGLPGILQHAKFLTIDSVFVDGFRSGIEITDSLSGTYTISGYPANYHSGSAFSVQTYYHGKGTPEVGGGAWGGVLNTGGMMFAMGVGFTAPYTSCTRHWMPCYDEPDDKADSVTLRFFADTSGIVVSNGLQTAFLPGSNGSTFCEWHVTHPVATYLLTFAYGPFQKLSIPNPLHIPFDMYAFTKDTAKVRLLMEKSVVRGLVYFDSLFAPYPFEKVGYVIAPKGSMEHQTMITLVNSVFDTNNTTAVHELSHQWWGDKVTCYDFNDPWLNEGFAAYCESLFLERFSGTAEYWKRQHAHIAASVNTAVNTTIPLYGAPSYTKPRNNYPPLIYEKGAAVLGMFRYIFGDSVFFNAIREYANAHAYGTVSSADLIDAFEKYVPWFYNKWIYGIGNPIYNVIWSRNANSVNMRFEQTQDSVKVGFFRLPIVIEARTYDGKVERHEILVDSLHVNQVSFQNSFIPDSLIVDPDGALIKKMNGTVKLGVTTTTSLRDSNMFTLRFNPNPAGEKKITVSIDAGKQENILAGAELMIFDTNGNNILNLPLHRMQINSSPTYPAHSYTFDIRTLGSGTYFATLLLNGATIGGRGNFTVSK